MARSNRRGTSAAICCALILAIAPGCTLRSISDSGRRYGGPSNPLYRGELSELDLLGHPSRVPASAEAGVRLEPGQRLLVMQSGALFPDQPVIDHLGEHFRIGVMSGIPPAGDNGSGIQSIAARGGFDAVLCYWGVLEARERGTAGMAASWIPIAGLWVPDVSQEMRIRIKVVVLDVKTGRWTCLLPAPVDDERASSLMTRESSDRDQVDFLKQAAYRAAVEQVLNDLGGRRPK